MGRVLTLGLFSSFVVYFRRVIPGLAPRAAQRGDCVDYAMFILSNLEHDDFSRHFALQCLMGASAAVGSDPGPAGAALRARAAELLTNGVKPIGAEAGHIREGVARLVADLAERSFPQVWPGFLEGVLGAWQGSADGRAAELAMLVLRNVAEDCTDAQFNSRLTTGRRNDILRAMKPSMEGLLALTFAYAGHQFQACAGAAGAGAADSAGAVLLRAALGMVRRLALWVRSEQLLTAEHDFVAVCLACLPLAAVRDEAVQCLAQLVARKGRGGGHRRAVLLEGSWEGS